jgi:hypothetical protein
MQQAAAFSNAPTQWRAPEAAIAPPRPLQGPVDPIYEPQEYRSLFASPSWQAGGMTAPTTNSNTPNGIPEVPAYLPATGAQVPLSAYQLAQAQAQAETQNRLAAQQARLIQAQQELAEAQTQALQRQAAALKKPMKVRDPEEGQDVDLMKKLSQKEDLTDKQTKQLFHQLDLGKYSAQNRREQVYEAARRGYAVEQLVKNCVARLAQTADEDGLVNFRGVPIPKEDLPYWIRKDLEYFEQTDQHLSPSQVRAESGAVSLDSSRHQHPVPHMPGIRNYKFPTTPDLPRSSYPSIDENLKIYENRIIKTIIGQRGSKIPLLLIRGDAALKFAPGKEWDLKHKEGIPKPGQWGLYKGQKVTDAYAANHAYGTALAYLGINLKDGLDHARSLVKFQYLKNNWKYSEKVYDQPEDTAAIISGYYEATSENKNPWPKNLPTPLELYRLETKDIQNYDKLYPIFNQQPAIKDLIEKAPSPY